MCKIINLRLDITDIVLSDGRGHKYGPGGLVWCGSVDQYYMRFVNQYHFLVGSVLCVFYGCLYMLRRIGVVV